VNAARGYYLLDDVAGHTFHVGQQRINRLRDAINFLVVKGLGGCNFLNRCAERFLIGHVKYEDLAAPAGREVP
jgi:hypothetical protein